MVGQRPEVPRWLGHLENGRDAGEMDRAAIGGTWGGTSWLAEWPPAPDGFRSPLLQKTSARTVAGARKNGALPAAYVR